MNNNFLFNLMNNFSNNNPTQNTSTSAVNVQNLSDYPDVVFTNNNQSTTFQNNTQNQQSNGLFGSLLNQDSIKQLLPLLFNMKGANKSGFNNKMLEQISPQFSQIMSLFTNSSKKKNEDKKENKNIIDISEYKEVN